MLYVFPHYVIAKWVKSLHHKDTNLIPNLQHQMRKFNVFNIKTCSRFPTKTSHINAFDILPLLNGVGFLCASVDC